ncbi:MULTISPECIES: AzlD domain-containing protein [Streptococcus]|uniref:AzlD domain-containing protein n=1 Tax=Streptococcus caledonicus TaxID=2614158 RepID=A0ABW0UDV3_9STRE|nr:AzlD domain-containing protein [Streptococcus sp. S784/96/1]
MTNTYLLLAIGLATLVTWVPRVLPYALVRVVTLPDKLIKFFNYLPVSIIFALLLSSVFTVEVGSLPQVKWAELIAVIPTFAIMLRTKNVMVTVVVGCICMAVLRLVF